MMAAYPLRLLSVLNNPAGCQIGSKRSATSRLTYRPRPFDALRVALAKTDPSLEVRCCAGRGQRRGSSLAGEGV